jgi:hypothetical protein
LLVVISIALTLGIYGFAAAHCDTMDGPVIQDARMAMETKDIMKPIGSLIRVHGLIEKMLSEMVNMKSCTNSLRHLTKSI